MNTEYQALDVRQPGLDRGGGRGARGPRPDGGVRHPPPPRGGRRPAAWSGVLSIDDLRAALPVPLSMAAPCSPEGLEAAREWQVGDVMTYAPHTIGEDGTLGEAADCMADYRIGCLPVVDGEGRLAGDALGDRSAARAGDAELGRREGLAAGARRRARRHGRGPAPGARSDHPATRRFPRRRAGPRSGERGAADGPCRGWRRPAPGAPRTGSRGDGGAPPRGARPRPRPRGAGPPQRVRRVWRQHPSDAAARRAGHDAVCLLRARPRRRARSRDALRRACREGAPRPAGPSSGRASTRSGSAKGSCCGSRPSEPAAGAATWRARGTPTGTSRSARAATAASPSRTSTSWRSWEWKSRRSSSIPASCAAWTPHPTTERLPPRVSRIDPAWPMRSSGSWKPVGMMRGVSRSLGTGVRAARAHAARPAARPQRDRRSGSFGWASTASMRSARGRPGCSSASRGEPHLRAGDRAQSVVAGPGVARIEGQQVEPALRLEVQRSLLAIGAGPT